MHALVVIMVLVHLRAHAWFSSSISPKIVLDAEGCAIVAITGVVVFARLKEIKETDGNHISISLFEHVACLHVAEGN